MERSLYTGAAGDLDLAFTQSRPKSAASWGAIIAGALVAIGVSLILFALGSGLGFASMSPWPNAGVGVGTFSVAAAIWLIVMQWISSLFGGYITGRLRTRWMGTHVHEIFFRDTANGLVTWALSTVVVAALLASAVSAGIGAGAKAASGVAGAGVMGASQGMAGAAGAGAAGGSGPMSGDSSFGYGLDKLFRPAGSAGAAAGGTADAHGADTHLEAGRILASALANGGLSASDRSYLASVVAAHTGASDAEAQSRIDDLIASANAAATKIKADADAARKDAAEVSLYTALSLLIGAFIASAAAALGGRLRDEHI